MNHRPMIHTVLRFSGCFALAALAVASSSVAQVHFSPEERAKIIEYWGSPSRYSFSFLPDAAQNGSWKVRQSVEGSLWLWKYQRALRPGKPLPGGPPPQNAQQAAWEAWIDRKVSWDFARAEREAAAKNAEELGRPTPPLSPLPPAPGDVPDGILRLAGEPPSFASAVQPRSHTISYEDGMVLSYQDNVPMRRKYAYYRFPEGVMSVGERVKEMPPEELRDLFREAGLTPSEMNIMKSVSLLEGGFDSINTYDTGFVSAGFIQFACLGGGAGSLGAVLLEMKKSSFEDFDRTFRRFGLEATEEGELVALCPLSGGEFIGPDAALKIISDRRLASVFQRAGRISRPYRIAQLRVAKRMYYPGDDVLRVSRRGKVDQVKVGDIFRSEAGLATLMDRKVNTGSLGRLPELVQSYAERAGVEDLSQLARLEFDLVREMRWRKDYLSDSSLSRPKDFTADGGLSPRRAGSIAGSRSGTRSLRRPSATLKKASAKKAPVSSAKSTSKAAPKKLPAKAHRKSKPHSKSSH